MNASQLHPQPDQPTVIALDDLLYQAQSYTEAYARTYSITDTDLLHSIYVTHLAYLLNSH